MIPFLKPKLPKVEDFIDYLQDSYENSWFTNNGPCCQRLEKLLHKYEGCAHQPILMSNATIALTVALHAFNLENCKVIVPSFTFFATFQSVLDAACVPILVDSDLSGLDLIDLSKALEEHPDSKALVVVQPLGYMVDVKLYEKIAEDHNLILIFDSAACLGGIANGSKPTEDIGDCNIYSLHATKTFGIGEGALVTSRHLDILNKCRQMINFGLDSKNRMIYRGTNAKISEYHCAIGVHVLKNIEKKVQDKKQLVKNYIDLYNKYNLSSFDLIISSKQGYQVFPILFKNIVLRDRAISLLEENNIGYKVYYQPIHRQPLFLTRYNFRPNNSYNKAEDIFSRILCIPFHEHLRVEEQALIFEVLSRM